MLLTVFQIKTDHWGQHFHNILNANDCDEAMKDEIMGKFKIIQNNPDMVVSTNFFFKDIQLHSIKKNCILSENVIFH